jgi:hypothetical protein
MAITMTLSNHYKYQLMDKQIDLSADTVKIILMNNTFEFDKDADATLADVTGDQLASLHGYTQNDKTLANLVLTEDDVNDQGIMTCDDIEWTASGGNLGNGATGAAILYDDTTADDTVIGCIDYGTDYTIPDGSGFQIIDVDVATT